MTYFVDRDLGQRVGLALRQVKVDVVLHGDLFDAREDDDIWIPEVTARGMVILTRDRRIRTVRVEREVFERAGARSFQVTTRASSALDDLRALLIAWPLIEDHARNTEAPFLYGVDKQGRLTQYIPVEGRHGPRARRETLNRSRDELRGSRGRRRR